MATAQSPNDLTRQQLDELDALLQKMLATPLNPPEGAAPTGSNITNSRAMVSEIPLPDAPQPRTVTAQPYSTSVTAPFPVPPAELDEAAVAAEAVEHFEQMDAECRKAGAPA